MKSIVDLAVGACSTSVEVALVNRLDANLVGVRATGGKARKATQLALRCGNTGYLVGRVEGKTILTADLAVLNAMVIPLDIDIDIPDGQTLSFGIVSSSGTAAAYLAVTFQE